MNTLISILLLGVLFAVFGLVQHKPDCGSNCGGCPTPCDLKERES